MQIDRKVVEQALEALEFMADEWGFTQKANRPERWKAISALQAALAQPEDKSQAAFEHWVETVEATQGCAISRNAVVDKLLTVTPAQMVHAEAMEPATINHDYERGFVDGMNHQARSSVDRAVNAMAAPIIQPEIKVDKEALWLPMPWKGLTDDERDYYKALGFVGVKAVEEKLRAKNSTLACIPPG